jgi:CRP-like cAMP-binding protein
MVIDEEILLKNKAEIQEYKAGEIIFSEDSLPKYYFQIRSGLAKLNTYREDGSEFIHSLPSEGHCFAETFLWSDAPYCINAESVSDTVIIKLGKSDFMQMLSENKDLTQNLLRHNSERMYYRHKMLATLSINNPSHRIYRVLEFLKTHHKIKEPFEFIVPFSRQQIANLTGLRVETVIRTVKKLEQENLVRISDGRICV